LSQVDSIIIGCGVAGSSAAITLANQGQTVVMLSASENAIDCNSAWAQGGIIYRATDDTPQLLAEDVHYAGAGLCNDEAVMQLGTLGPQCVEELLIRDPVSVPFDRQENGELSLCLEASHNRARIIHWKDQTGLAITQSMQAHIDAHPNITTLQSHTAIDFLKDSSGQCIGVQVLNGQTQHEELLVAPSTILASGGLGEVYAHTSNHVSARGDGFALAHRAGASLSAMEYVQFHPTTFFVPGDRSFLLTEALRGEGARLLNHKGQAFAKDYHPLGELAPRDVVSRMIMSETQRTGQDHVWLDISHRDATWLRNRFPSIYQHCLAKGFDMTLQALPVVPAAHYFCGGVDVNLTGRTTIPGLYAAGEVSCTGLHGGNRLASTSLLEGLVWGRELARDILSSGNIASLKFAAYASAPALVAAFQPRTYTPLPTTARGTLSKYWTQLQHIMWTLVGIRRSTRGLQLAEAALSELHGHVTAFGSQYAREGEDLLLNEEYLGLRNGLTSAQLVAAAAANNPISCGAHFRTDEPLAPTIAQSSPPTTNSRRPTFPLKGDTVKTVLVPARSTPPKPRSAVA
jgi:L-aspartate oxidase